MSGRYGNHSDGHGGLDSGSSGGKVGSTPRTSHIKKKLGDSLFYVGSIKKESDYEITTDFVVNHIIKTFYQSDNI